MPSPATDIDQRVVLATGNPGQVEEMHDLLCEFGLRIVPQSEFDVPDAVEDGLSFVENAIIKARHACQLTGLPAIADDSGLEVDALQGVPGIYSARYAARENPDSLNTGLSNDEANNVTLLAALGAETNRAARFQCVLVYMRHAQDPTPLICQGTWEGEIAKAPRGEFGFGYDPVFYVPELGCHSAELEPARKKQLSHRGQALAKLKSALESSL